MNCCVGLYRSFVQVTTLELYVDCDNVLRHFTIHLTEALYTEKKKKRKKKKRKLCLNSCYTLYTHSHRAPERPLMLLSRLLVQYRKPKVRR